jgi:hypothetical protein
MVISADEALDYLRDEPEAAEKYFGGEIEEA